MINLIGRRFPGLAAELGNNADAMTAQLRVMNDRTPTQQQLEEVGHLWELHRKALDVSLAGFQVRHASLSDDSQVRIVSNSGMHVVQLWPAGGSILVELVEEFWGIPANSVQISGGLSPPSGTWRVAIDNTTMPPALKQKRDYALAADPTHPGHVTWSSPDFLADKQQVVLTWRGPRDRYAASTGWSTAAGGASVAHNETGESIGTEVFKDSAYLWINGRKVLTPVTRVLAASIHCPDPIGAPGDSVLRIATDNVSGDGTTRKLGVKDLVPTGATGAVSLGALLTASSYVVLNTYTATLNDNTATVGHWQLQQRPHFDYNGNRLACTIKFGSSNMTSMVSLNAESFAILEQYDCTSTLVRVGSRSIADTGVGSNPRTITIDETDTRTTTEIYPLACDFLGANFVRAWVEAVNTAGYIAHETSTTTSGVLVRTDTTQFPKTFGVTVKHSVYGDLLADSQNRDYTATFNYPGSHPTGTASYPGLSVPSYARPSFIGNLARDAFAVGYRVANGTVSAAATTERQNNGLDNFIYALTTRTFTQRGMTFSVWLAGVERLAGTTGSFVNDADVAGTTTTGILEQVSNNLLDSYSTGSLGGVPPSGTTVTPVTAYRTDGGSAGLTRTPTWAHIACNARLTVAYFGLYHSFAAAGAAIPAIKFGLEQAWFRPPTGVYTSAAVPAYAPANPRPTISAPVFPGVTRKELAQ